MSTEVVCIADLHLLSADPTSQSYFPKALARLSANEALDLHTQAREAHLAAYNELINQLRSQPAPKLLVVLGDLTSGYREKGAIHPSVQTLYEQSVRDLCAVAYQVEFCAGNHDTGYKGSVPGSDINPESVAFCEKAFGRLYWSVQLDGVLHLGISSPLARYEGNCELLKREQRLQSEFVVDTLLTSQGMPWIFYSHSPEAIRSLHYEIDNYLPHLLEFVFADYHAPWAGRICKWIALSHSIRKRSVMCPSLAPVWCRGYRFLTLSYTQSHVNDHTITLSRPSETRSLVTSHPLRCLRMMLF